MRRPGELQFRLPAEAHGGAGIEYPAGVIDLDAGDTLGEVQWVFVHGRDLQGPVSGLNIGDLQPSATEMPERPLPAAQHDDLDVFGLAMECGEHGFRCARRR
jgi:hypothetical protein